ncbi:MAG: PilZ domain-containing protein [Terriglobia bacterium]
MAPSSPRNEQYYSQFGRRAAFMSLLFPGLGQIQCRAYLKGTLIVSLFSFVLALRMVFAANPAFGEGGISATVLTFFPLAVWGISIYDAYRSAIEIRRSEAKRYNVQVITTIRGIDSQNLHFEEITMTKNISQRGACLVMSRLLNLGTVLSLDFQGKSNAAGRVVWTRDTGNADECLVGMELLSPLKRIEAF